MAPHIGLCSDCTLLLYGCYAVPDLTYYKHGCFIISMAHPDKFTKPGNWPFGILDWNQLEHWGGGGGGGGGGGVQLY